MKDSERIYSDHEELPPTDFELEERRHVIVRANNATREKRRLAEENRKKKIPAPKVGDVYFVTPQRGLARRSRAGLKFEKGGPTRVEVVDGDDEDILDAQRRGLGVVNLHGAETILGDDALNIRAEPQGDMDVASLQATKERLEEELQLARADLAKLRREARQAAPESVDGKPSRLPAARAVPGGATQTHSAVPGGDEEFGASPGPEQSAHTAPAVPAGKPTITVPQPKSGK